VKYLGKIEPEKARNAMEVFSSQNGKVLTFKPQDAGKGKNQLQKKAVSGAVNPRERQQQNEWVV